MTLNHLDVPDFSCEIDRPIKYLEYIHDQFSYVKHRNEHGQLIFDEQQADTFSWMLSDAMTTIYEIQKALYPETKPQLKLAA